MGFRCEISGKHIQGKPLRVIAATREVDYPERFAWITQKTEGRNETKRVYKCIDPGGHGHETVKEILVDSETPKDKLEKFLAKNYRS